MAPSRIAAVSLLVFAWLVGALVAPLAAQDRTATSRQVRGVLELFTSQGCAECLPANALIARKGESEDIVALAYHVDYWDYIGWQDPLAAKKNVERQKAYAKRLKLGTLTTPQIVVNGAVAMEGSDENALVRALDKTSLPVETGQTEVRMEIRGDMLRIEARAPDQSSAPYAPVLVLVTYSDQVETPVSRGANEGRVIVDRHPVRDWRLMGTVDAEPMRVEMPLALVADPDSRRTGLAALLQVVGRDDKPGRILAAAALEF